MEKFLYGKGWNIRGPKDKGWSSSFLAVRASGETKLVDSKMKGADYPWARFISKESAENFLTAHPIEGATVVQPIKSKYFKLVDDASGLYKTVSETDKDLLSFGIDNVQYIEDDGTISDLPPVPGKVNPLDYLFKDYKTRWSVGAATVQQSEITLSHSTRLTVTYFLSAFVRREMKLSAEFRISTKDPTLKEFIADNDGDAADVVRSCPHYNSSWRWSFLLNSYTEEQCIAGSIRLNNNLLDEELYKALLNIPELQGYPKDFSALSKTQLAQLKKNLFNKEIAKKVEDNLIAQLRKQYVEPTTETLKQFAEEFIQRGIDYNATEEFDENLSLHELFERIYNKNY